jgi:hypothetical protein
MENRNYQLFLDLDGVLVDFDRGVFFHTGKSPNDQTPKQMWSVLARVKSFYSKLDWMADGKLLWEQTKALDPVILTGLPLGKWAEPQKRAWCKRELGKNIEVICGMSRDKHLLAWDWLHERGLANVIPVLIDDRLKTKFAWEESGGKFILHFSAEESLRELQHFLESTED